MSIPSTIDMEQGEENIAAPTLQGEHRQDIWSHHSASESLPDVAFSLMATNGIGPSSDQFGDSSVFVTSMEASGWSNKAGASQDASSFNLNPDEGVAMTTCEEVVFEEYGEEIFIGEDSETVSDKNFELCDYAMQNAPVQMEQNSESLTYERIKISPPKSLLAFSKTAAESPVRYQRTGDGNLSVVADSFGADGIMVDHKNTTSNASVFGLPSGVSNVTIGLLESPESKQRFTSLGRKFCSGIRNSPAVESTSVALSTSVPSIAHLAPLLLKGNKRVAKPRVPNSCTAATSLAALRSPRIEFRRAMSQPPKDAYFRAQMQGGTRGVPTSAVVNSVSAPAYSAVVGLRMISQTVQNVGLGTAYSVASSPVALPIGPPSPQIGAWQTRAGLPNGGVGFIQSRLLQASAPQQQQQQSKRQRFAQQLQQSSLIARPPLTQQTELTQQQLEAQTLLQKRQTALQLFGQQTTHQQQLQQQQQQLQQQLLLQQLQQQQPQLLQRQPQQQTQSRRGRPSNVLRTPAYSIASTLPHSPSITLVPSVSNPTLLPPTNRPLALPRGPSQSANVFFPSPSMASLRPTTRAPPLAAPPISSSSLIDMRYHFPRQKIIIRRKQDPIICSELDLGAAISRVSRPAAASLASVASIATAKSSAHLQPFGIGLPSARASMSCATPHVSWSATPMSVDNTVLPTSAPTMIVAEPASALPGLASSRIELATIDPANTAVPEPGCLSVRVIAPGVKRSLRGGGSCKWVTMTGQVIENEWDGVYFRAKRPRLEAELVTASQAAISQSTSLPMDQSELVATDATCSAVQHMNMCATCLVLCNNQSCHQCGSPTILVQIIHPSEMQDTSQVHVGAVAAGTCFVDASSSGAVPSFQRGLAGEQMSGDGGAMMLGFVPRQDTLSKQRVHEVVQISDDEETTDDPGKSSSLETPSSVPGHKISVPVLINGQPEATPTSSVSQPAGELAPPMDGLCSRPPLSMSETKENVPGDTAMAAVSSTPQEPSAHATQEDPGPPLFSQNLRVMFVGTVLQCDVIACSFFARQICVAFKPESVLGTLVVRTSDLKTMLVHLGPSGPVVCLHLATDGAAELIHRHFSLSRGGAGPCYNPFSPDEAHRYILLIPSKTPSPPREHDVIAVFERMRSTPQLESVTAAPFAFHVIQSDVASRLLNNVMKGRLVTTTGGVPSLRPPGGQKGIYGGEMPRLAAVEGEGEDEGAALPDRSRSPSPPLRVAFTAPIVKLFTYPPPPAPRGLVITNEDYFCLQRDEFLNDVIIDFYLQYLVLELLSAEDRARTHVCSSFFYRRLTQRDVTGRDAASNMSAEQLRHARVSTWTRRVDLFSKDFIIVPINESLHWYLAVICFPGLTGPVYAADEGDNPLTNPEPASMATVETSTAMGEPASTGGPCSEDSPLTSGEPSAISGEPLTSEKSAAITEKPLATSGELLAINGESLTSEVPSAIGGELSVTSGESPMISEMASDNTVTCDTNQTEAVSGNAAPCQASENSTVTATADDNGGTGERTRKRILKQPCILIFDSLAMPSRYSVVRTLREYIQCEWNARKAPTQGARSFSKDSMKGACPRCPLQTNLSDCGVFVLQYTESFFADPIKDYNLPISSTAAWFTDQQVAAKRESLKQLIAGLQRTLNPDLAYDPEQDCVPTLPPPPVQPPLVAAAACDTPVAGDAAKNHDVAGSTTGDSCVAGANEVECPIVAENVVDGVEATGDEGGDVDVCGISSEADATEDSTTVASCADEIRVINICSNSSKFDICVDSELDASLSRLDVAGHDENEHHVATGGEGTESFLGETFLQSGCDVSVRSDGTCIDISGAEVKDDRDALVCGDSNVLDLTRNYPADCENSRGSASLSETVDRPAVVVNGFLNSDPSCLPSSSSSLDRCENQAINGTSSLFSNDKENHDTPLFVMSNHSVGSEFDGEGNQSCSLIGHEENQSCSLIGRKEHTMNIANKSDNDPVNESVNFYRQLVANADSSTKNFSVCGADPKSIVISSTVSMDANARAAPYSDTLDSYAFDDLCRSVDQGSIDSADKYSANEPSGVNTASIGLAMVDCDATDRGTDIAGIELDSYAVLVSTPLQSYPSTLCSAVVAASDSPVLPPVVADIKFDNECESVAFNGRSLGIMESTASGSERTAGSHDEHRLDTDAMPDAGIDCLNTVKPEKQEPKQELVEFDLEPMQPESVNTESIVDLEPIKSSPVKLELMKSEEPEVMDVEPVTPDHQI